MARHVTANDDSFNGFAVSLVNEQSVHVVDESQLVEAVRCVLHDSNFRSANVSLAVVDDATIHELNRRYLNHDYATDVISFVLDDCDGHLEGEIVISADTAASSAAEIGWSPSAEQLLYIIHGTLHLAGYDDKTAAGAAEMRAAEASYLRRFGHRTPSLLSNDGGVIGTVLADGSQEGQVAP